MADIMITDSTLSIAVPHPLARLLDAQVLYAFYGEPARDSLRSSVVMLAGDAG